MPNYPYDEIKAQINREFVAGLNKNFDEVEQDVRALNEPLNDVLDGNFDGAALATEFEIRAQAKLEEIKPEFYEFQTEVTAQLAENGRVLQGIDRTFSDETFGTLLELKTKYPNGNDERHVVSTDGYWYWWNGSEWVPGQVAQSIGIADKSVGVKKIRSEELEVGDTGYLLPINEVSWINRSINTSGEPATVPTTDRILSSLFAGVKIDFSPSLGNGRVSIYKYNLDGTYIGQSLSGIRTSPILLEQGYIYRAFYAFDPPTTLDPKLVGSDLVFYGAHQPIKLQKKSVGIDKLDDEVVTRINRSSTTKTSPKFMHISSDDTLSIFEDINTNSYSSIFDNSVLGFLKNTHEDYGMTFSFYCWHETVDGTFDLTMFPSTYADEFKENSDWLKFGVHYLKANGGNFGSSTAANTAYVDIMTELFRICGGADSLDFVPRFHAYLGSLAFIEACRDSHLGLKGLLTSEDVRTNYYLDEYQSEFMQKHDRLFDYQNNLMLFSTDIRLEYTPDVTSSLSNIVNNVEYASRVNELIIFTHEQYLNQTDIQQKIIECCNFALANGYDFDFPQNRI